MKEISFHRALSFLLTKRTIQSYSKLTGKSYQIADTITGNSSWCDFFDQNDWGECTNAYQSDEQAKFQYQNLFSLDIQKLESEYPIKIVDLPPAEIIKESGVYVVNTSESLSCVINKKLKKNYPYQSKSYSRKGTLIVGIFDPVFGGFVQDLEINQNSLLQLKQELRPQFDDSSFSKILLVHPLTPFQDDPKNHTYELF